MRSVLNIVVIASALTCCLSPSCMMSISLVSPSRMVFNHPHSYMTWCRRAAQFQSNPLVVNTVVRVIGKAPLGVLCSGLVTLP